MSPLHTLLSLILITSATVGARAITRTTGKASLRLEARINEHGNYNVAGNDLARAQAMKAAVDLEKRFSTPMDITNAYVYYTTEVGVGSPPTNYTLMIDTGSSNTWLGAGKSYVKTSTSRNTGFPFTLTYGAGGATGEEWNDTVTLSPALVITNQSIGVASNASGFFDIDGILGVGPVYLTMNTVKGMSTVPTVSDNLLSQNKISRETLGVYFTPASENTGSLVFGGIDIDAIKSWPIFTPLTQTYPASKYWGINQTIDYDGKTILPLTAGIVDTGTTQMLMANDAFQLYMNMTGATVDSATGLLKITPENYSKLQPLTFNIGGMPFVVTRDAQTWPRSLNTALRGGVADAIYLVVGGLQWESGSGFDFVIGYTFHERYYTIYDAAGKGQVGFAETKYTFAQVNYPPTDGK